jgi:hypothetical protein
VLRNHEIILIDGAWQPLDPGHVARRLPSAVCQERGPPGTSGTSGTSGTFWNFLELLELLELSGTPQIFWNFWNFWNFLELSGVCLFGWPRIDQNLGAQVACV